jgi:hypothetical protein
MSCCAQRVRRAEGLGTRRRTRHAGRSAGSNRDVPRHVAAVYRRRGQLCGVQPGFTKTSSATDQRHPIPGESPDALAQQRASVHAPQGHPDRSGHWGSWNRSTIGPRVRPMIRCVAPNAGGMALICEDHRKIRPRPLATMAHPRKSIRVTGSCRALDRLYARQERHQALARLLGQRLRRPLTRIGWSYSCAGSHSSWRSCTSDQAIGAWKGAAAHQ